MAGLTAGRRGTDQPAAEGLSVAGHFGEWLQGRLGPEGPVVLVTLCCPVLRVTAVATGGQKTPFDPAVVARFREVLCVPDAPWPQLRRDMPLGAGAGASTATLVALALAAGFRGAPEDLARACQSVEGASDPLMMPEPDTLLWASRQARAIERHPPPPRCTILGGFWGAPQRTDPEDTDFADVSDLARDWKAAVERADLAGCAAIASASAQRCDALRGPGDPMPGLAASLGALGHLRAHTGSARGLIFARDAVPDRGLEALKAAGLTGGLRFDTGRTA